MLNLILSLLTLVIVLYIMGDIQQAFIIGAELKGNPDVSLLYKGLTHLATAFIESLIIFALWIANIAYRLKPIGDNIEKQTYLLGQSTKRTTSEV